MLRGIHFNTWEGPAIMWVHATKNAECFRIETGHESSTTPKSLENPDRMDGT